MANGQEHLRIRNLVVVLQGQYIKISKEVENGLLHSALITYIRNGLLPCLRLTISSHA
jgi:hypothetical protein